MSYLVINEKFEGDLVNAADINQLMTNEEEIVNGTKSFNHITTLDTTVVTNLNADMVDNAHKSTDVTFASSSNNLIPTELATKTYIDNLLHGRDVIYYKGSIPCSTNPNYPAGDAGWLFVISVGGKIGGVNGKEVEKDDTILCLIDGTVSGDEAAVGNNWAVNQGNIIGAVTNSSTGIINNVAVFSTSTGKVIKNSLVTITPTGALSALSFNGNTLTTGTGNLNLQTYTLTATSTGYVKGTNTGDITLTTSSGLVLTNQIVSMGTPSNLSISTTNLVTGSTHTHEITKGNITTSTGLTTVGGTNAVLGSGVTINVATGYMIPTTTDQINWNGAHTLEHNLVTLPTSSGLVINDQELSLGVPSTITGISTNLVTTDTHTHALANILNSSLINNSITIGTTTIALGETSTGLSGLTSITSNRLIIGPTSTGYAPIKITSGPLLVTPEDGALEYDGNHFYATIGTNRQRVDRQIAYALVFG